MVNQNSQLFPCQQCTEKRNSHAHLIEAAPTHVLQISPDSERSNVATPISDALQKTLNFGSLFNPQNDNETVARPRSRSVMRPLQTLSSDNPKHTPMPHGERALALVFASALRTGK